MDPQLWVKTMGTSLVPRHSCHQGEHTPHCGKSLPIWEFSSLHGVLSAKSNPLFLKSSAFCKDTELRSVGLAFGHGSCVGISPELGKSSTGIAGEVRSCRSSCRHGLLLSQSQENQQPGDGVWGRPGAGRGSSMLLTHNRDPLWSSTRH